MAAERNAFAVVVFSIFGVDIVVVAAETAVAFADSAELEVVVVAAAAAVWHNTTAAIVGFVADIHHVALVVGFACARNTQSDTSGRLHGIPRPSLSGQLSGQLFRAFQPIRCVGPKLFHGPLSPGSIPGSFFAHFNPFDASVQS